LESGSALKITGSLRHQPENIVGISIEENRHPYFFVLQIEGPATVDLKTTRLSVLNAILKEQGFFEGKR
jgi:hypothetical protein